MNLLDMNSIGASNPSDAKSVANALSRPSGRVTSGVTSKQSPGAASSGTSAPASTAASSSDITSNDFLTLLVSELKNQDPTQPTDPNAYISQLVGVNSLQQLISINQGLTSIETPVSGGSSPTGAPTSGS